VAIGNPLEMGFSIGKSVLNSVFSIAMFDYRRVDLQNSDENYQNYHLVAHPT
jgi:hypothetical protein